MCHSFLTDTSITVRNVVSSFGKHHQIQFEIYLMGQAGKEDHTFQKKKNIYIYIVEMLIYSRLIWYIFQNINKVCLCFVSCSTWKKIFFQVLQHINLLFHLNTFLMIHSNKDNKMLVEWGKLVVHIKPCTVIAGK